MPLFHLIYLPSQTKSFIPLIVGTNFGDFGPNGHDRIGQKQFFFHQKKVHETKTEIGRIRFFIHHLSVFISPLSLGRISTERDTAVVDNHGPEVALLIGRGRSNFGPSLASVQKNR